MKSPLSLRLSSDGRYYPDLFVPFFSWNWDVIRWRLTCLIFVPALSTYRSLAARFRCCLKRFFVLSAVIVDVSLYLFLLPFIHCSTICCSLVHYLFHIGTRTLRIRSVSEHLRCRLQCEKPRELGGQARSSDTSMRWPVCSIAGAAGELYSLPASPAARAEPQGNELPGFIPV